MKPNILNGLRNKRIILAVNWGNCNKTKNYLNQTVGLLLFRFVPDRKLEYPNERSVLPAQKRKMVFLHCHYEPESYMNFFLKENIYTLVSD